MLSFRKTRIAPTPSGYLHAGNALNFLLTEAMARQAGASVLLRIDDMDRERYRPEYGMDIFETLQFLELHWQEGPRNFSEFEHTWSQQHRLPLYDEVLKKLQEKDCVFACTCSRKQQAACRCYEKNLPLNITGASWRLLTDKSSVDVKGLDGNIITAPLPAAMKHFSVRRKDGLPAYQLCSVVDDLHFGIDFIVRGEDLWPSTLAQHYLARQLGEDSFSAIRFHHHPLLKDNQGEKLSKSAGAFSVKQWREQKSPFEAYLHYLGTLLQTPVRTPTDLLEIMLSMRF